VANKSQSKCKKILRFVDNTTINAKGIGKVITTQGWKTIFRNNMLYVLTIKTNLLYQGKLLEKSFHHANAT